MGTYILRAHDGMEYDTGIHYFVIKITKESALKLIRKIENLREFARSNRRLLYQVFYDSAGVYCSREDLPDEVAEIVQDLDYDEWDRLDVSLSDLKQPCKAYVRTLTVECNCVYWDAVMGDFNTTTSALSLKQLRAIAAIE